MNFFISRDWIMINNKMHKRTYRVIYIFERLYSVHIIQSHTYTHAHINVIAIQWYFVNFWDCLLCIPSPDVFRLTNFLNVLIIMILAADILFSNKMLLNYTHYA